MDSAGIDSVRSAINGREDKKIDFKRLIDFTRERSRNDIAIDAISFANAEGGTIIVGVEDKTRDIVGIPAPLNHDQIVQSITELTEPPIDVCVDTIEIDGKLLGIIRFQRGKTVHWLRKDGKVYIRRDGINHPAKPAEIAQLFDERDYSSRVYLCEPYNPYSCDHDITMLTGEESPYRKIAKRGGLGPLSECPVFLPEFSRWISAPEFGDTQGTLMISYPDFGYKQHDDFIRQVENIEDQLNRLARYLSFGAQANLNWSISDHGTLCYGEGSKTLLKAIENGERGAISIAACGEFRGSVQQSSFILLIGGYYKCQENNTALIQDRDIRLYLSTMPVSNAWVHALFSPFLEEDKMPFSFLSYELVHPRLRVWRPAVSPKVNVQIRGTVGRYLFESSHRYSQIGAVIADTKWFTPNAYKMDVKWDGNLGRNQDDLKTMFVETHKDRINEMCPLQQLSECIVSLTNPVPSFEEILAGDTKAFHLPLIKHLELGVEGHNVHVIGMNASPIDDEESKWVPFLSNKMGPAQ